MLELQSWTKVVWTVELDHIFPIPPNQCRKMWHFSQKKGKNHLIINIVSAVGEKLFRVPTFLSVYLAKRYLYIS